MTGSLAILQAILNEKLDSKPLQFHTFLQNELQGVTKNDATPKMRLLVMPENCARFSVLI